jgi:sulfate transport system substrate-binding protein
MMHCSHKVLTNHRKKNMSTRFSPLRRILLALALGAASLPFSAHAAPVELLNVSYDVARELYKDVNPAFTAEWKKKTGEDIVIKQSHGGSSKQARSVADHGVPGAQGQPERHP